MFYGTAVKPGASVKLNADGGEVLHISGACLSNPSSDERTYLILHHEDKNHVLCCLRKDHSENVPLDVFVPTRSGAQLKVQGKSEVHVIGYYEPMDDASDIPSEGEVLAMDDEDESTQVSSDDERVATKSKKIQELVDDDGSNNDQDDDEDEEEDNSDDQNDEEDDDDDDDDEEELKLALQKQLAQKKAAKQDKKPGKQQQSIAAPQKNTDKKRKAGDAPSKPEKQQKTSSAGGSQGVTQEFEKAVTTYLTKHGRSLISQVASACPKPSAVTSKYREFLVSRPSVFVVEGQYAAMKA